MGTLTSLQFLKKILKLSPFSIILTIDLPHIAFIKLRYVPSTFSVFRVFWFIVCFLFLSSEFYGGGLLDFVEDCFFINWDGSGLSVLTPVHVMDYIYIDLCVLNQPCIPGGDANLVYDLNVFLIQLEKKCYWHLNLCLPWKLVCSFLFCSVLIQFTMGIMLVLQNGGVFPFCLREQSEDRWQEISFKGLGEFCSDFIWPWTFLCWETFCYCFPLIDSYGLI